MNHPIETQIDDILSKCDGDARAAIKILLVVNEQLETDLQQLTASAIIGQVHGASGTAHNS
jgi:type III secretory pathway lipoprotein EscJ